MERYINVHIHVQCIIIHVHVYTVHVQLYIHWTCTLYIMLTCSDCVYGSYCSLHGHCTIL